MPLLFFSIPFIYFAPEKVVFICKIILKLLKYEYFPMQYTSAFWVMTKDALTAQRIKQMYLVQSSK